MVIERAKGRYPSPTLGSEASYGDLSPPEGAISTINELIFCLQAYLTTYDRDLHLGHGVLSRKGINELIDQLSLPETSQRLKKLRKSLEFPDPLFRILGGKLIKLGFPEGVPTKKAAENLFLILEREKLRPGLHQEEVSLKKILSPDLLENAMGLTMFGDTGSIIEQLGDPLCLSGKGLIVTPVRNQDDPEDRGFALPETLLTVLEGLKEPESTEVLENWLYETLSGPNADDCIIFLKALAQFSLLLDQDSYIQLYASETGEIPLLPFQSFHRAVKKAQTYLSGIIGAESLLPALQKIEDLVLFRFHQIIEGPFRNLVSAEAKIALTPQPEDLALMFVDWFIECEGEHELDIQQAARFGIEIIDQLKLTDPIIFCQEVSGLDPELGEAVTKEAKLVGMIPDEENIPLKQTLEELKKVPFIDAAEIDFAEIINPETETLEVYLIPGTFGPFTLGHKGLVEKTVDYTNYLDALDPSESHIQRIILIVPVTNVENLRGYKKDPARIGPVYARVGSMLIHLAGIDRKKVFITTSLQPDPRNARRITTSITDTIHAFRKKIGDDLLGARSVMGVNIVDIVCFGMDEFMWENTENGLLLADQQPKKTRRKSLAVGRFGYLIPAIRNGRQITNLTQANLILTPGTLRSGSTEIIENVRSNNLSIILPAARQFINRCWNPEAIREREEQAREKRRPEEEIPSVTKICEKLTEELRVMLS